MIHSVPVCFSRLRVVLFQVFTVLLLGFTLFLAPACYAQTSTTTTSGTVIIKSGDAWEFWDKATEPPTSATWATGRSPLGYQPAISSYPITTTVASTSVAAGRAFIAFRKTFPVPTNYWNSYFVLRYRRDDGISIFLNQRLIVRDNLSNSNYKDSLGRTASQPVTTVDSNWYSVTIPGTHLFYYGWDYTNPITILATVHQETNSDADLFFDLELVQYSYGSNAPLTATPLPIRAGDEWETQNTRTYPRNGPPWWPLSRYKNSVSYDDYNKNPDLTKDNWRVMKTTGNPARVGFGYPGDTNPATTPVTSLTTYGVVPVPVAMPFGDVSNATYFSFMPYQQVIFRKKVLINNLIDWASFNLKLTDDPNEHIVFINDTFAYRKKPLAAATTSALTYGAFIGSSDEAKNNPLPLQLFKTGENLVEVIAVNPDYLPAKSAFNLELTGNPARAYAPVASRVQSQTAFVGQAFSYTVPAFSDNNVESLTYSLNGTLPSGLTYTTTSRNIVETVTATGATGLTYTATTRVITGIPSTTGITSLTISATDPGGLSAVTAFTISVLDPPKLLRGPYLQNATTSGMTFRFRSDVACVGRVSWDNRNAGSGYTDEDSARIDHVVSLTGLLPYNYQFSYTIGCTNGAILDNNPANYFRAAPPSGANTKTRIWSLGDFGIGTTRQTNVRKAFENYVKSIDNPDINLWLWLGDNSYEGTDPEFQKYVFSRDTVASPFAYGNSRFMRQTPIYAVPGNHDYLGGETRTTHKIPYFDLISPPTKGEAGGVASGKKEYYSFNYNNIHFVALDSYGFEAGTGHQRIFDPAGPQITWLKKDLAAAHTDNTIKWIVAFWHHPPYSRGTHNTDTAADLIEIRQNIIPILEQYRVDLVMNGHSHVYERSGLMRGLVGDGNTYNPATNRPADAANAKTTGKFDGSANSCFYVKNSKIPLTQHEGTVYVVNGSGGAGGNVQATWPHPAMVTAYNTKGVSMYLEVDGGRLDAKAIDEDGKIIDQFTIYKDICPPTLPQGITCNCGGKTLTPPPALSLITPGFDCKTGSLTFVTAGGDGSKIEYQIAGQTSWTATATTRVSNLTALLGNPATSGSLTLLTRQSSTTLTGIFDVRSFCPPVVPISTTLTVLVPTYNCQTGAIVLNPTGGNGSPITFSTPGIQRSNPVSASGTVEAGVRNDAKTLTITATQNGTGNTATTVSYVFDLKAACSGSGRGGVTDDDGLQITVFGNPTTDATVDIDIRGAGGRPLRLQLTDAQGKVWTNLTLKSARAVERQTVTLGRSAGVYVLTVSTDGEKETVKIVRE